MDQTAAVVAAWREVQSRPFVIPEEMTDLAIALDRLVAAYETAPAPPDELDRLRAIEQRAREVQDSVSETMAGAADYILLGKSR